MRLSFVLAALVPAALGLAACHDGPTLARPFPAATPLAQEAAVTDAGADVSTPDTSHLAAATADPRLPVVTVWKTPTCGCCNAWIAHLRSEGFRVDARNTPDLAPVKLQHGVPSGLGSCHTALVDGLVVEGHVPASDVKRLLAERPRGVRGIAVPGMPIGSPGMEVPGQPAQPYDVVAFGEGGQTVFASHR